MRDIKRSKENDERLCDRVRERKKKKGRRTERMREISVPENVVAMRSYMVQPWEPKPKHVGM